MARNYFDRDSENLDYERDQFFDRGRRRSYGISGREPRRRDEFDSESSIDRDPRDWRDYGRRASTGGDYGTAFGSPLSGRDYGREGYSDRDSIDIGRRQFNPYSREYGSYSRDYSGDRYGRRSLQSRGGRYDYEPESSRYDRGGYGERGWWDRVSDEVASWFGDEEAERRRRRDEAMDYRGRGPKNYRRSDERIKEDVNDRLTDHPQLDASDIDVNVSEREVTLTGSVNSRYAKRLAEDIVESVSGVTDVQNNIRVRRESPLTHSERSTETTTPTTTTTEKSRARSA